MSSRFSFDISQIVLALDFLAENHYVHRDVAARNCLGIIIIISIRSYYTIIILLLLAYILTQNIDYLDYQTPHLNANTTKKKVIVG